MSVVETCLMVVVFGQLAANAEVPTVRASAEQRLAYMQTTGNAYNVTDEESRPVKFRKEPVLRWTNPVSGVVDGGLFLWENENGRPVAAAQIFIAPGTDDLWLHEFQSLAEGSLRFEHQGRPAWTPRSPGVELKPIPNAPLPAATAGGRLSQMRQIARRFSVTDDFEGASSDQLRLMTSPLARYADNSAIDGALFVFAHGTDPEMFVVIEARRRSVTGLPAWHAGLAPMTAYAIDAELDGQPFWSVDWRKAPHPITAIFKNFVYPPKP